GGGGIDLPDCVDADQDGYGQGADCRGADCDDNNPNMNPGAVERCDGFDNDCDGATDEDLNGPDCALSAGVCAGSRRACVGGQWAPCEAAQFGADYEAEESLCDNLDNDCDGFADEDCACEPGASRPCGFAEGECQQGLQRCVDGDWGACEGEVSPADEICDGRDNNCDGDIDEGLEAPNCALDQGVCAGAVKLCEGQRGWGVCGAASYGASWAADEGAERCDGLDNDCDGEIDEGCACVNGEERPCGSEIGACALGVQACVRGAWAECRGQVAPTAEICDGLDNDCDGETDEALDAPACALQLGVCARAAQTCAGAEGWRACDAATYAEAHAHYAEVEEADHCDSLDNDCDGQIDEGCDCVDEETQPCGQNQGQCTQGTQTCVLGVWGSCSGVAPTAEICDGVDNDCDGEVDEALTRPDCAAQEGVCAGARRVCVEGVFIECGAEQYGASYQAEEARCDGLDNDCDGEIDEGCVCVTGAVQNCGSDEGACAHGTQTCVEGDWGPCEGLVGPRDEICDGLDNDCDGEVDEGLIPASCEVQFGVCAGSTHRCGGADGWLPQCDAASYGPRYVLEETSAHCDGIDNDCDGQIDEPCECIVGTTIPCGSDIGACEMGTMTCLEGGHYGECEGGVPSIAELCDGLDNDCDGEVDEDLQPPPCPLQAGVCQGAIKRCGAEAGWLDCAEEDYSIFDYVLNEETSVLQEPWRCDGFDNDCDGEADEACPVPHVLISEVMYDGPGADGPHEFIELGGAPIAPLGGLRLEAVNGNDGAVYWSHDFAPGQQLGGDGYFLITSTEANPTLKGIADAVVDGADLQNGPDSLRLMWHGGVIDALAYGAFTAEQFPAGEGAPARDVSSKSLMRDLILTDTDDNATDFLASDERFDGVPTPGGDILPRLYIQLNWDAALDFDLHMMRPNGALNTPDDCYYGNRSPAWGPVINAEGARLEGDPVLLRDVQDGAQGESIRYTRPLLRDACVDDQGCGLGRACVGGVCAALEPVQIYLVEVVRFTTDEAAQTNATVGIYLDGAPLLSLTQLVAHPNKYWAAARIIIDEVAGTITAEPVDQLSEQPIHNTP
ncbi:hypothetical protein KJ940_00430, partial [Myxococcota bacterium]|nr:hypothetical protein [Myxococcota bacterium]